MGLVVPTAAGILRREPTMSELPTDWLEIAMASQSFYAISTSFLVSYLLLIMMDGSFPTTSQN